MNGTISGLTADERYVAFLLTAVPKLHSTTLKTVYDDPSTLTRADVMACTMSLLPPEESVRGNGLCLEFGVYRGGSIRFCATKHPKRHFYGFDSFEGFPDDGRSDWKQDFSVLGNLPAVPDNVTLVKGWFSKSLPPFLEEHEGDIDFLNIDCDIYSSTVDVFLALEHKQKLRSGILIFFDELLNYKRWLWNESLALFEMLERTGLGFEWICAHQNVRGIEESLHLLSKNTYPLWDEDVAKGYRQQASLVLTDKGIDYGPLNLPHYRNRVKELAKYFRDLSER